MFLATVRRDRSISGIATQPRYQVVIKSEYEINSLARWLEENTDGYYINEVAEVITEDALKELLN